MHDRRIDGEAHTFGNQGGLFLRAMVWWDHETESFWSQPTGQAILGDYTGVRLKGVAASIEPWSAWFAEHPDTLVMSNGLAGGRTNPFSGRPQIEVAGVLLGDSSKAWVIEQVRDVVALNDYLGDLPVLVYANPETRAVHIYLRQTESGLHQFSWVDGRLIDDGTGTEWSGGRGLAIDGSLAGEALRLLPHSSAFDWAWDLHHPRTTWWPVGR